MAMVAILAQDTVVYGSGANFVPFFNLVQRLGFVLDVLRWCSQLFGGTFWNFA